MTSLGKSASLAGCCSIHPLPSCASWAPQAPHCYHTTARTNNERQHRRQLCRRPFSSVLSYQSRDHDPSHSGCPTARLSPRTPTLTSFQKRHATVAADGASEEHLHWPQLDNPRLIPTPYEIFNQSRHEPYSKRRFYELVKIYHPDRQPSSESHTPDLRIERYRLVVAANAILSDPTKRYAYDRTGRGWAKWRTDGPQSDDLEGKDYKYTTFHRWRKDVAEKYQFAVEDDPMFCATWEDWEKWYHRQQYPHLYENRSWTSSFFSSGSAPRQTEVYTSNYVFLMIAALVAALGGTLQATRADSQAQSYRERATKRSEEVGKRLNEARDVALQTAEQSKDTRIRNWVRSRDEYHDDGPDGRTAMPGDDALCAPGMTKDRDDPAFWERPPGADERDGR